MSYNLFLDDTRDSHMVCISTEESFYDELEWEVVRNYHQFIEIIMERGLPETISFDHDLGEIETGMDCAKWLILHCISKKKELPANIFIHSMNTTGSLNMQSLFNTYFKSIGSSSTATWCRTW
jgi:hypothetical protein